MHCISGPQHSALSGSMSAQSPQQSGHYVGSLSHVEQHSVMAPLGGSLDPWPSLATDSFTASWPCQLGSDRNPGPQPSTRGGRPSTGTEEPRQRSGECAPMRLGIGMNDVSQVAIVCDLLAREYRQTSGQEIFRWLGVCSWSRISGLWSISFVERWREMGSGTRELADPCRFWRGSYSPGTTKRVGIR